MPGRFTIRRSPIKNNWLIQVKPSCIRMPGFKGMSLRSSKLGRRKKKPRGGELPAEEKRLNRMLSRMRVRVEHALAGVKRSRIVKDVFRNKQATMSDRA